MPGTANEPRPRNHYTRPRLRGITHKRRVASDARKSGGWQGDKTPMVGTRGRSRSFFAFFHRLFIRRHREPRAGWGRDPPAELSSWQPLAEVKITSETRGGLVVSGFGYFPESTRLSIALVDTSGRRLSWTQAEVENGLFQTLPLVLPPPDQRPSGELNNDNQASFAPGNQDEEVLAASDSGRDLSGEGMTVSRQGHPVFHKRFRLDSRW